MYYKPVAVVFPGILTTIFFAPETISLFLGTNQALMLPKYPTIPKGFDIFILERLILLLFHTYL